MEKCQTRADDILNETFRKSASVPVIRGCMYNIKALLSPELFQVLWGWVSCKKVCHVSEPRSQIMLLRTLSHIAGSFF